MAKRSQMYQKLPWNGGVNSTVDSGVLDDNDLVTADNVVFATSGSRLKREGLSYLDTAIPTPDLRSSSGTTRTIKWTTNSIKQTSASANELLVNSEYITVATSPANANYNTTEVVGTITHTAQVATVQTVAAGALNDTYFYLDAAEGGIQYYVWMNEASGGTDPLISGRTGAEVTFGASDTADQVATAIDSVVNALSEFSSTVSTDTVTITCATAGVATNATDAGTTGFTLAVTTEGSSNLTYESTTSLSDGEASAAAITVTRAEDIISILDYWRTDSSNVQQQRLVSHTNYGKMFYYSGANNRVEITGQEEVSSITTVVVASLNDGDYFIIYSANDAEQYNIWMDVTGGGSGPSIGGVNIQIDLSGGASSAQDVATEIKAALDLISPAPFATVQAVDLLTITTATAGETTDTADGAVTTGFTFATSIQGATLPTTDVDQIRPIVFNNKLIHCYTGVGNLPTKYRPEDSPNYMKLLNAPDAAFMGTYLSRLWCNDKTDPHRLHYCTTANEEEWNGTGDSGALDIEPGDGDPVGITAIYSYKGALFVAKKTKVYRILGDSPENFQIVPITKGLGAEGSMVVNVDQDDAVFVSKRGLHSAQATDQFGDVSSKFLSKKIQPTFNSWTQSALENIQGAWVPQLNSVLFGVPATGTTNNEVWALNVEMGAWYRWPSIDCQAVSTRLSGNTAKPVFGTTDGRVIQAQNGDYSDFDSIAYTYKVKTGRIYPGGNPQSTKGFKRIGFFYKPVGDFQFTVSIKIDNLPTQAIHFAQESATEDLGVDFILGQSVLGFSDVLAPYMQTLDGYGRGLTIEISQTSLNQQVEIYGFVVEYEEEGTRSEVQND